MKNRLLRVYFLVLVLVSSILASSISDSKDLSLTIYTNNVGVVNDLRTFNFDAGTSNVTLTDVPETLEPQTVVLRPVVDDNGVTILQQQYLAATADRYSLLEYYVGKNVTLTVVQGTRIVVVKGVLLSYSPSYIIQTSNGIQIFDAVASITLDAPADGVTTQPSLVWTAQVDNATSADYELTYRVAGVSWTANYVAVLSADETTLELTAWATVTNSAGRSFDNATINLVSGDVNVQRLLPIYQFQSPLARASVNFDQANVGDYRLYTLARKSSLPKGVTQFELFQKIKNISVTKYYDITVNAGATQESIKASISLEFNNSADNSLGNSLPKGIVRVYKEGQNKTLQFLGEDNIDSTPSISNVTLQIGFSSDLVVNKTVLNRQSLTNNGSQVTGYDANVQLDVSNRGANQANVRAKLSNYYGDNLNVTSTNGPQWTKVSTNLYESDFQVNVNATVSIAWTENQRN